MNYLFLSLANAQVKIFDDFDDSDDTIEINLNVGNIGVKSANFSWEYPEDIVFLMGDYINLIVFEDSIGDRGQIPIFSVAHNVDNINLKSITSFVSKSLSPSTSYTAKIEFVRSDGSAYESETTFTTSDFVINEIKFQNVQEDITSKKKVRLFWSVSNPDIEFIDKDNIQVFMKSISDNDFSKKPIFETNEKVNRADIELPNFEEAYNFKIVYNIGNKKVESETFFLDAVADGLNFKVTDLTMSSAKFNWDFLDKDILNDDSEIQIFIKEDMDITYNKEPILKLKGKSELSKTREYLAKNLKFDTKYNLKVKFIIENKAGIDQIIPILKEEEYEFKTLDFKLKDLKVNGLSNNKCNLSWDYDGEKILFNDDDYLKIYIKEVLSEEYQEILELNSQRLISSKNTEIILPKYNTEYDIKIDLIAGSRNIVKYINYIVEVPEVIFNIKEIKKESLKVSSIVDPKFVIEDGDKLEIFAKESGVESNYIKILSRDLKTEEFEITKFNETLAEEVEGKKFDFKINVIKNGNLFQEKIYTVEMKDDDLQIVNVFFKNKSEKQVEAVVEYAPCDFDFKDVESLSLFLEEQKKDSEKREYKKITSDFKTNNKFDIDFDKYGDYKLTFVYKFRENMSEPESSRDKNMYENENSTSSDQSSDGIKPKTVDKQEFYNHKFDVFSFKCVDIVSSELKFKFLFKKYYKFKDNDKIEIFVKKPNQEEFPQEPIVIFEHSKDNIDNIGVFDMLGFDFGTEYVFKAKFISNGNEFLESQVSVTTRDINIENIEIEHLEDISGAVKWKLNKDFSFTPNDVLKIFYKKESEQDYGSEANEIVEDINLQNGAFIYFDSIDTKYDIKLIFESGENSFEKYFKLETEVSEINLNTLDIYQTSAYITWNYPDDYLMIGDETISIFVKDSNQLMYDEEEDYFMINDPENSEFIEDFKSIKLSKLLPNTSYDVRVVQDFGEIGMREAEVTFKTKDITLSDVNVITLKQFEFEIMWELNSDTIEFDDENDFLNIYMKTPDEEWNEDSLIYSISDGLNNFNKARFIVDDSQLIYEVKLEYNIANKKISKNISTGLFYIDYNELNYDESGYGEIDIILNYPLSMSFRDGDSVTVFVSKPKTNNYEQKFISKHSQNNDLNSLRFISVGDIKQTSSIAVYLKSNSIRIFPSEIIYDTRAENSTTLEIVSELRGEEIQIALPVDYELDKDVEIINSIGGESRYERLSDGTDVIVISKIVPGKKYKKTILIATDVSGEKVELYLDEFILEPTTLLEEFLRNSYFFAFDREPDEGGYNYWKGKLDEKGDVTGKYFLVNLMFAEKEFSDRNLSDEELVKALYQIVVNREYDSKGLSYWMVIYNQYLTKFNGDKYEAKKTMVMRMVNEPEFGRLCKQMNIKW